MSLEFVKEIRGEVDRPLARIRFRFGNAESARREVDVTPAKGARLAYPQVGQRHRREQRPMVTEKGADESAQFNGFCMGVAYEPRLTWERFLEGKRTAEARQRAARRPSPPGG